MISFSKILKQVLNERMSFRDLLRHSDPARIDRSRDVRTRSLDVRSMGGNEAWTFTYKSSPSTTGHRWHGYVRFLKEDVSNKDRADQLDCMVDCDCPDYRFRFAYNNAKADAGALGAGAWNQNNGQPPRPRSQGGVGDYGVGMCKHLISLAEFLKTNIEPDAPEPDEPEPKPIVPPKKPIQQPKKPSVTPAAQKPQTINAPEPEDTYSDSRSDTDTDTYSDSRGDLQEGTGKLAENLNRLVLSKPTFQVPYPDEN